MMVGEYLSINPDRFDKLITSLRTSVDNDGTLDKESTSYNDIFDAFRLALKFIVMKVVAVRCTLLKRNLLV
jgi:hypothetical protein